MLGRELPTALGSQVSIPLPHAYKRSWQCACQQVTRSPTTVNMAFAAFEIRLPRISKAPLCERRLRLPCSGRGSLRNESLLLQVMPELRRYHLGCGREVLFDLLYTWRA